LVSCDDYDVAMFPRSCSPLHLPWPDLSWMDPVTLPAHRFIATVAVPPGL